MTENKTIIELSERKKELEKLCENPVPIEDVVSKIVEVIKQLVSVVGTQQQSIDNLAYIAEKTIELERGHYASSK